MQAEITETKIVFPTDVGLVWGWAWLVYEPGQNEDIRPTNPIDLYQLVYYVACNRHFQKWKRLYEYQYQYVMLLENDLFRT